MRLRRARRESLAHRVSRSALCGMAETRKPMQIPEKHARSAVAARAVAGGRGAGVFRNSLDAQVSKKWPGARRSTRPMSDNPTPGSRGCTLNPLPQCSSPAVRKASAAQGLTPRVLCKAPLFIGTVVGAAAPTISYRPPLDEVAHTLPAASMRTRLNGAKKS